MRRIAWKVIGMAMAAAVAAACGGGQGGSSLLGAPEDLAGADGADGGASSGGGTASGPTSAPLDPMTSGVCAPEAQQPKCAPASPVASNDDVSGVLDGLSYIDVALGEARVLRSSNDLIVSQDLDLDATNLTPPTDCGGADAIDANGKLGGGGCASPSFRTFAFPATPPASAASGASPVDGVTCTTPGTATPARGPTCAKLHLASGAHLRLREVVEDMGPGAQPRYWPFVEIVAACSAPCAAGQQRCGDTQTCFAGDFDYCAYCDGRDAKVCSCLGACNVSKPEGGACTFTSAPGSTTSGTCNTGVCTAP